MRKSVAISLLLIYIISSSGVAIRAYYSSGKLTSINLILDRSTEKAPAQVKKDAKSTGKNNIATCKPADKKPEPNSLKKVLQCVTIVSNGFFEAYDDADTTPACTTCAAASSNQVYPSHMVSID